MKNLSFTMNRARPEEIGAHLALCDARFTPPLSQRVDLVAYAKKIVEKGVRFEAWFEGSLVGLVAMYCNDPVRQSAFVTNVSVTEAVAGEGVASKLFDQCVAHATAEGFERISLEVNRENNAAIALYRRKGFLPVEEDAEEITFLLKLTGGGSDRSFARRLGRRAEKLASSLSALVEPFRADALIALVIFLFSIGYGLVQINNYRTHIAKPNYYQVYFEPAINLACGHGFGGQAPRMHPEVEAFLYEKKGSVSCEEIAPEGALQVSAGMVWYYMQIAYATAWRLFGLSWNAIDKLVAIFFGLSVVASYGLFRLGMGRVLAVAGALLLATSDAHIGHLPFMRDFAKEPFFLLALLAIAAAVRYRTGWVGHFLLAILAGALIGIGYGFRPDALILIPPGLVTFLFLTRRREGMKRWVPMVSTLLFMTTAIVAISPITAYQKQYGSCMWHFPMLGLGDSFTRQLGIDSPRYSFGYQFNDMYNYVRVESYGHRVHNNSDVGYCTNEYDRTSQAIYTSIVEHFPADFILRTWGAFRQVSHFGLETNHTFLGADLPADPAQRPMRMDEHYRDLMLLNALLIVAFALVDLRYALFFSATLLYFLSYPAAQFHPRHYFHLEIFTWWSIGVILAFLGSYTRLRSVATQLIGWREWWPTWARRIGKGGALVAALFFFFPTLHAIAKMAQGPKVVALAQSYHEASTTPAPGAWSMSEGNDLFRFDWAEKESLKGPKNIFRDRMLKINYRPGCLGEEMTVKMVYETTFSGYDYTHLLITPNLANEGGYDLFTPVYFMRRNPHTSYPDRVEIAPAGLDCIGSIDVVNGSELDDLWIDLLLPHEGEIAPLYGSLTQ